MRDSIHMREFLPATQAGLRKVCQRYQQFNPDDVTLLEHWALLFFLLRGVPDEGHFFPSGKWATIQRLEGMLDEWAFALREQF